jgi:hypothetical protein
MMNKNDVISVVSLTGEFVGKYVSESDTTIVVKDPRLVMQRQDGIGFIPAVCMTGIQEPDEVIFYKSALAFVIKTADEVEKVYRQSVSGIIL